MTTIVTGDSPLIRLYADERIIIGETTGKETLAESGDIFTSYLDLDFDGWGTKVPGAPTTATPVAVYEMRKDADFRTMFGSLGNPRRLCLSQGQIRKYCRQHRDKLHPKGWATFFLFEVKGELLVARVGVRVGSLEADVYRFDGDYVWIASRSHRLVVPEQKQ